VAVEDEEADRCAGFMLKDDVESGRDSGGAGPIKSSCGSGGRSESAKMALREFAECALESRGDVLTRLMEELDEFETIRFEAVIDPG